MRILSYDEARGGSYPTKTCFPQAMEYVRRLLQGGYRKRVVNGAMFFGSAVRGTAGPLSDLDVLVVYHGAEEKRFFVEAQIITERTFEEHRVPVEIVALSDEMTGTGWHDVGAHLFGHLQMCMERFPAEATIVGNPIGWLLPHHADMRSFARDYVLHKLRAFTKGLGAFAALNRDDSAKRHLVAKAIDFPVYAGRMVQGALGLRSATDADGTDDVLERFREYGGLVAEIRRAIDYRRQFLGLLERDMDRVVYGMAVTSLGQSAVTSARETGKMYLRLLNDPT